VFFFAVLCGWARETSLRQRQTGFPPSRKAPQNLLTTVPLAQQHNFRIRPIVLDRQACFTHNQELTKALSNNFQGVGHGNLNKAGASQTL
jgi:hypothetical protein